MGLDLYVKVQNYQTKDMYDYGARHYDASW